MKGINQIMADTLKEWPDETDTSHGWKLARPIGYNGIFFRLKMAWRVFTGKADLLYWYDQ